MIGEAVGQADRLLGRLLEHRVQQIGHESALVPSGVNRRREPRVHQLEAGGAEEVALRAKLLDQRIQQSLPLSVEAVEELSERPSRDRDAEVGTRGILKMMPLVDDE